MPLENSLNVSPYFDDYDQAKEFYKILFKPGVSVQTRELNQLQTMLQSQIERFGNHVFKSGTVISGVNFSYLPSYTYVKILDTQNDGQPSLPSSYVGYFLKSDLNLTARIVNYQDGLETKTPDLKTLYLQYVTSSDADVANSNTSYTTFAPGQTLTVFSKDNPIFEINVNNGGLGFSNADSVIVTSSITVSGNTVAFSNGETLTQSTTGAKVVVASINTTAIANTVILKVKPRSVDLTNNSVNATAWSLSTGYNIAGGTSGATANVVSLIGASAQALLTTDTQGIVQSLTLTEQGANYTFLPHVTIKTSNTTATVNNLDLTPQNYKTTITVANSSVNAIGTGYAFGVSEGLIYQKGFFLKVNPQIIIVDKYTTAPDAVAVGFQTAETTITAFADETLYDNAANTTNYAAPGADRLQLTPTLTLLTSAEAAANADFFSLAEWKEGQPFKENRTTMYSNLGDEMARRTRESQGNFVIDPFEIGTKEKTVANTTHVTAIVDPGVGYINGYRVYANYNTYLDVERAATTQTQTNKSITVNYGNYVLVKELAGFFNFKAGATVSLRSVAKSYVSTSTVGSSPDITPAGSEIGTARMRSLVVDSGNPGTPSCVYRMYLFDVKMNAGFSFRDVRGFYYDSTEDGISDAVLQYDATTSSYIAVLTDKSLDKMIFPAGQAAVSTITNISFQYRTSSDTTLQLTSSGQLAVGPLGTGLTFPYADGVLSATQKRDFIVMPIANTQAASNAAGSVALVNTSNVASGTSTTFASDFQVGDFVNFSNGATSVVRQITYITNNTSMGLNSNSSTSFTANAIAFYPAMYPLALENRADRTITISGGSKTATLNITNTLSGTVNAIAVYNVSKTSASPVTKTINRDLYVKIHTSNNAGGATGPWDIGIPGTARLKNVYLGSNTTVNTSSTDITKYFYVNVNDDENVYRNGKLVLSNKSAITLTANQYLMVKLDAFTTGGMEGFFTADSYSINDAANLASSTSTINTLEIPETITKSGQYFDLRDVMDFRPYSTNTAVLSTTAAGASINPANTVALSGDDQFFPVPDSTVTFDISYYVPRRDVITVDVNSNFGYVQGAPSLTPTPPQIASGKLQLGLMNVPAYPSLPSNLNETTTRFASKQVGNDKGIVSQRINSYTMATSYGVTGNMQPRRYAMSDINKLEKRVTNLEYTVSLSAVEKSIVDLTIPSAITPSVNRFKNAFFTDPFVDFSRSDVGNREYAASIDTVTTQLKPQTRQLNFECMFDTTDATTLSGIVGNSLMLPFTEEVFVDQSVKSDILGSDGHAVQFVGTVAATPPSFSILAMVETIVEPPVSYSGAPGVSGHQGGDHVAYGGYDRNGFGYGNMTGSYSAEHDASMGRRSGDLDAGYGSKAEGNSRNKIVCTAMNESYGFGSFRNSIWLAYSAKHLTKNHEVGYHAIFLPLVDYAYKKGDGTSNRLVRNVLEHIARHRSADCRAEMRGMKRDKLGRVYRAFLEPICYAVGYIKTNSKKNR